MNALLQTFPKMVKVFETKDVCIRIDQHGEFYVVSYNGDSLHPVTNLTVALGLFETLAKEHYN